MTLLSKTLGCCALCVLLGASQGVSAQTTRAPKKPTRADSASQELSRLAAAAQEAVDRRDYATAAQKYQDYLAKKPDDAAVHYDLGYVYTAMQQPEDAKEEYEKAISLDPKMAPAYLNLGLTLLPSDPGAAIEPLVKATELMPDQARPKFLLGTALERSGKSTAAIEQFQAAEKIDEKDFDIRVALGGALLDANRLSDAEAEFRAALASPPERGETAPAHLGLARALVAGKKLEAAAAELGAYLEGQPDDASVRVERASLLVDLGKNDEALAELDRAASVGPEGLHALKLRSQVYYQAKRYDDAVPVLQRAAAIAPKDPDIAARLGHLYLEKKDYPHAVSELVVAHNLDPKATDVLSELVFAEYMNKNYPAALEVLDALSKREELPAGSWFIRAVCYDKLEQPAQALDAYQRFLQLNKDENNDMYFESAVRVRVLKRELQEKKR